MVTDDIDRNDLPYTRREIERGLNAARLSVENLTEELQWIWKHRHDKERMKLYGLRRIRILIPWLREKREDLHWWRSLAD